MLVYCDAIILVCCVLIFYIFVAFDGKKKEFKYFITMLIRLVLNLHVSQTQYRDKYGLI